jgi:hypothetical protein
VGSVESMAALPVLKGRSSAEAYAITPDQAVGQETQEGTATHDVARATILVSRARSRASQFQFL